MPEQFDPAKTPVSPALMVDSVEKALDYYTKVLGFENTLSMPGPDGKTLIHAEARLGASHIMFGRRDSATSEREKEHAKDPLGRGVVFYAYVANVDEYYQKIKANGARVLEEPKDQFWGDRTLSVADPQGYLWTFAQHVHEFDPGKVPWKEKPAVAEVMATA